MEMPEGPRVREGCEGASEPSSALDLELLAWPSHSEFSALPSIIISTLPDSDSTKRSVSHSVTSDSL